MTHGLEVQMRHRPVLDPGFLPAVLWNRAYEARVRATRGSVELGIALVRQDGTTFTHKHAHPAADRGPHARSTSSTSSGWSSSCCGRRAAARSSVRAAIPSRARSRGLRREGRCAPSTATSWAGACSASRSRSRPSAGSCRPRARRRGRSGRHLDGCRIGFDLGGSDRKCAAVIDGKVVFSDEVVWNPYFEKDPRITSTASTTRCAAPPRTCRASTRSAAAPPAST